MIAKAPVPDEPREDLSDLAAFAFRFAQEHCGACRGYHAIWGYERLAAIKGNTFDSERDILGPALRERLAPGARLLIAGAADAGLLAFVHRETRAQAPDIAVADMCATPLAVCRRHAASTRLDVATVQHDLAGKPLAGRYDLVFAHNILLHLKPERWAVFLRNLRLSLDRRAVLILVHSMRPKDSISPAAAGYGARTIAALAAQNIPLPEDEASFRRRLESRVRVHSAADLAHLEACLAEAGLTVHRRIDHERRRIETGLKAGAAKPVRTHIFVATAA